MKIAVVGCGRWGSLIAWYLDRQGHEVVLYGRESSPHMRRFLEERKNDLLTLPERLALRTDVGCLCEAETVVISIASQGLRDFLKSISGLSLHHKTFVLCMKGIEKGTLCRLSEVAEQELPPDNSVAVWLGPGHVQEFYAGIPNCMVMDSREREVTQMLVEAFSSNLIRFYYGNDLIGNEIGGASKNVIGIAAGILDGLNLSTLKGALMARGAREIGRLIAAMGGQEISAYGLCHLGDYEATVFSPYSHNRRFGEALVKGEPYELLAEGYHTAEAMMGLSERYGVELPICRTVYEVLYRNRNAEEALNSLFSRKIKDEF